MADDLRRTLDPTLRGLRHDDGSPGRELVVLSEHEYRQRLRMAGRGEGPRHQMGVIAHALCALLDADSVSPA
jgi:hypothetical protein